MNEKISNESSPANERGAASSSANQSHQTAASDRVPFWVKCAYGIGSWPDASGGMLVKALAMPVYNMILGVNPALLGLFLGIPRLWDAITDPVMGSVSDNFHSKYGRRRPFIFIGAISMGVSFALIWMVPEDWSSSAQLGWFLVTSLLFYTCYTVYSVPLHSLGYELTPDYDERTRVMAYSSFFSKVCEFSANWIMPIAALAMFASLMEGIRWVTLGVGFIIMAIIGIIPALFVKERYYRKAARQKKIPLFEGIKTTFKNRAFLVLLIIAIFNILSGMIASGVDYYLIVYYMCEGDIAVGSYWKAILSSGYAVVGILAIWPISYLATHFSKRRALIAVYGLALVGGFVKWFVFVPGSGWWILLDPLFCGPIYTAIGMVVASMIADICDDDELRSGARREGSFGAVFTWIKKTGISLAFFGTGIALNASGFDATLGAAQDPASIYILRLFLSGATIVCSLAAILMLSFYPITREQAEETRRLLEARRGTV